MHWLKGLKAHSPAVELENVSVSYDRRTPVLRNVSLKIYEGELVFIIGPNGGGKTTLLKTITGALKPEHGKIKLFGVDISKFREWWMVGYVPQNAATYFERMPLSVEEFLKAISIPARSMILEKALELVGVQDPREILNKKISTLSGGNLQKIMLASALINQPKLLLLDEPTVYVDQIGVGAFMNLIDKLVKDWQMATLIATHDVSAISTYATRVICINREELFDGSIDELAASERLCRIYGFHVYPLMHGHGWQEK